MENIRADKHRPMTVFEIIDMRKAYCRIFYLILQTKFNFADKRNNTLIIKNEEVSFAFAPDGDICYR